MNNDKDEKELDDLLSPIIEMWDYHSNETFEHAAKNWEVTLAKNNVQFIERKSTGYWSIADKALFSPIQRIANWYRRKLIERKVLEKRTIPFLMSVGLIKISEAGDIAIHAAPIQPDVANILAFSIAAIFGCCVFWIIFIAQAGLVTIIQSTGIGLIIGTLISLLHDFSYRKEVILEHLSNSNDY
jgi:hypothetical protein